MQPAGLATGKAITSWNALGMPTLAGRSTFCGVNSDPEPEPPMPQAKRRSLAIVQAGHESAASGEPIDLESRFDRL